METCKHHRHMDTSYGEIQTPKALGYIMETFKHHRHLDTEWGPADTIVTWIHHGDLQTP